MGQIHPLKAQQRRESSSRLGRQGGAKPPPSLRMPTLRYDELR
jgi:hypothetical protein